MKMFYRQKFLTMVNWETGIDLPPLREDIQKTGVALEAAYSGFNNALEPDIIDSYIYEINALLKRYKHLTELTRTENLEVYDETPNKPHRSFLHAGYIPEKVC